MRLLDAARAAGVQRFVQVSTDEVYGSLGPTGALHRETPLSPEQPVLGQQGRGRPARAWRTSTRTGWTRSITRCSNNYGPYQFPEKLIPLMILNALRGQAAAGLRRRHAGARLDPRRGPLRGVDAVLTARAAGRGLQLRRPQRAPQHRRRARDPAPRSASAEIADPLRHRPPRPRPPLRHRLRRKIRARTGLAAAARRSSTAWPRPSPGTGRTRAWTERVRSGDYRDYYEQPVRGTPAPRERTR